MTRDETGSSGHGPCAHFVLAQGIVARVAYCDTCGIFHLDIDSMSIRFRATALRDLRDTLSAALATYARTQERADDRPAPAPNDGLH